MLITLGTSFVQILKHLWLRSNALLRACLRSCREIRKPVGNGSPKAQKQEGARKETQRRARLRNVEIVFPDTDPREPNSVDTQSKFQHDRERLYAVHTTAPRFIAA
jgi:hypothetical protein